MGVTRFLLFVAFAYALASQMKTEKRLIAVALVYGAGLLLSMTMSDSFHLARAGTETRFAGGGLNSNVFGGSALVGCFLGLFVVSRTTQALWVRLLGLFFSLVGGFGVLISVSRGVILGAIFGLAMLVALVPLVKTKAKLIIAIVFAIGTLYCSLPREAAETIAARVAFARVEEDRGSGRLDIWGDYLRVMPDYIVTGVGLGRSREVTKGSHSTGSWRATHSEYLGTLVEFGILGLVLLVLGLIQLWRRIDSRRLSQGRTTTDAILLAFLSCWMLMFVFGRYNSRALWVGFAFLAAYGSSRCLPQRPLSQSAGLVTRPPYVHPDDQ